MQIPKMLANFFLLFLGCKMASRYSQEYFFQHCLMNVPFSNLNDIIHPNAENIPEYICHFASAMFKDGSFWMYRKSFAEELQKEGNSDDCIDTFLSYVDMLQKTYNLVTKGKIFLMFLSIFKHNVL